MTPSNKQLRQQLEMVQRSIVVLRTGSPIKSPARGKFLTKDSNVTGFAAFDVDGRVDTIESRFEALKAMVDSTMQERNGRDEALELTRRRGELHFY